MPDSFTETSDGILLVADGLGPLMAWDGFAPQMRKAGVPKPLTPVVMAATGSGRVVGKYRAYLRFVDDRAYPSNLSPVSAEVVIQGPAGSVAKATSTSPIVLRTENPHGLTNGSRLKVSGVGGPRSRAP
jgi:hypothetical protein